MIQTTITDITIGFPFGKYKHKPMSEVPTSYLLWALRECRLSNGLRNSVANELGKRGVEAPPPPPPRPIPPCRTCPGAGHLCYWMQDRLGRRIIRAECRKCRRLVDHPPCVPPYSTIADATANPTVMLDVLTRLDDLGMRLHSDGRSAWIGGDDYRKVPPDLKALVKQCSHELAKMIGNTMGRN
jgi:hypothetical protein